MLWREEVEGRTPGSLKAESLLKVGNSKEHGEASCSRKGWCSPTAACPFLQVPLSTLPAIQPWMVKGLWWLQEDWLTGVLRTGWWQRSGFHGFSCSLLQVSRTGAGEVCGSSRRHCLQVIGSFTKVVHDLAASTSMEYGQAACRASGPAPAPAVSTRPR